MMMVSEMISRIRRQRFQKIGLLTLALLCAPLVFSGCGDSNLAAAATAARHKLIANFHGKVHVVKMYGSEQHGYYYDPAIIRIKSGDMVRFVNIDGGPHNVSFANEKVPRGAMTKLIRNGEMTGPLLQVKGEHWDLIFPKKMPTGVYPFICQPHAAMGMRGEIIVSEK